MPPRSNVSHKTTWLNDTPNPIITYSHLSLMMFCPWIPAEADWWLRFQPEHYAIVGECLLAAMKVRSLKKLCRFLCAEIFLCCLERSSFYTSEVRVQYFLNLKLLNILASVWKQIWSPTSKTLCLLLWRLAHVYLFFQFGVWSLFIKITHLPLAWRDSISWPQGFYRQSRYHYVFLACMPSSPICRYH
jgi:hypothetical protein